MLARTRMIIDNKNTIFFRAGKFHRKIQKNDIKTNDHNDVACVAKD